MSQLMNATFSRKNRLSVSLLCNLKFTKHAIHNVTFYVLVYILNLFFHAVALNATGGGGVTI